MGNPGRPGIQAELSAPNQPKSGTGPQTALTSLCLGYRLSDNHSINTSDLEQCSGKVRQALFAFALKLSVDR